MPARSRVQHLPKQRDLTVGRALPIELLGIASGCRARRRRCGEFADCFGESLRRNVGNDATGFRRTDNLGNPARVGDDDRSAAGHALQQNVRPSLMRRDEQKEIGRGIDFRKAILRHRSDQSDALRDAVLARRARDRSPLGSVADDDEFEFRQPGQRFDHELVALQSGQIAYRK